MFDHVKFGVSDFEAGKAFFLKALAPLGVAVVAEGPPAYGVELAAQGPVSLCLFQTDEKPAHLHLAFAAESRQQVDAFYRAALEAGGQDNGPPGLRPHYHAGYYAAFVIGPDGHNWAGVAATGGRVRRAGIGFPALGRLRLGGAEVQVGLLPLHSWLVPATTKEGDGPPRLPQQLLATPHSLPTTSRGQARASTLACHSRTFPSGPITTPTRRALAAPASSAAP